MAGRRWRIAAGAKVALLFALLSACPRASDEGPLRLATDAGGDLRSEFSRVGASVTAPERGAWAFRPSPWGLGCDAALEPLEPLGDAAPVARGARVVYERPELDEWYERTPRGLEQGFTLASPPPCRRSGGKGVVIAFGAGLSAVVRERGREAALRDASGKEVLRYADLSVVDAAGRALPAVMEARGSGLAVRFDDDGAVYPVVVDPLMWTPVQQLADDDASSTPDFFGEAVAVNGDTIVVGSGSTFAGVGGTARVFARSGTTWSLQQELTVTDQNELFGTVVALGGNTVLVTSYAFGNEEGTVHGFVRSGTTWTESFQIAYPQPTACGEFRASLAFDGATLVVGATGVGYVFVSSDGQWMPQSSLVVAPSSTGCAGALGAAVALDGDSAIVAASEAASVFARTGDTWTLQQHLDPPAGGSCGFWGASVAIARDTVLIGVTDTDEVCPTRGLVSVWRRTGKRWIEVQQLAPPAPSGSFGTSVSLIDGVALVGDPYPSAETPGTGVVYAYASNGGMFSSSQTLLPKGATPGNAFGSALASQGGTLVVGAPGAGAAYVMAGNGQPCSTGAECGTGNCVDGVCCQVPACPGEGPCNSSERCQAGTGTCSTTPFPAGTPCSPDGCSNGTCAEGVCSAPATICAPVDGCHEFGVCDPANGGCSNPPKPDDAPCPGGVCLDGVCTPRAPPLPEEPPGGCACRAAHRGEGGLFAGGLAVLVGALRAAARARGRRCARAGAAYRHPNARS
jgi:hypothetical protein